MGVSEQTTALLVLTGTLVAALVAFGLLLVCIRHRGAPAAVAVGVLQLGVMVITLGSVMILLGDGGPAAVVVYYLRFVGYLAGPVAALLIALEVTGRRHVIRPWLVAAVLIVPVTTLAIIVVAPEWMAVPVFERQAGLTMWRPVTGPWFPVYLTYTEGLMVVIIALLLWHAARHAGRERARSGLLAVGAVLPVAVDIFTRVVAVPRDLITLAVSLSFLGTGVVFAWVMLRHRFIALSPLAIGLFDAVGEPIYAIDDSNRLSLVNKAFAQLCGTRPDALVGMRPGEVRAAPDLGALLSRAPSQGPDDEVHVMAGADGRVRSWLVSRSTLTDGDGTRLRVGVLRDITERKDAEDQRDKLVEELRDALANVKTLRGFIPICAACHKVRDDKGYWQAVEEFVRDHTDAQFSHGLCPSCAPRFFPDVDVPGDER